MSVTDGHQSTRARFQQRVAAAFVMAADDKDVRRAVERCHPFRRDLADQFDAGGQCRRRCDAAAHGAEKLPFAEDHRQPRGWQAGNTLLEAVEHDHRIFVRVETPHPEQRRIPADGRLLPGRHAIDSFHPRARLEYFIHRLSIGDETGAPPAVRLSGRREEETIDRLHQPPADAAPGCVCDRPDGSGRAARVVLHDERRIGSKRPPQERSLKGKVEAIDVHDFGLTVGDETMTGISSQQ